MPEESKAHRTKHPLLYIKEVEAANKKVVAETRAMAEAKRKKDSKAKAAKAIIARAAKDKKAAEDFKRREANSRKIRVNPLPMTEEARANMAKTDEMLEIKRKRAAGEL